MPVNAASRFGALPSSAIPRVLRGDEHQVWCDFRDIITGALTAVSGVTATVWVPGGAELSPAPVPVQEATGIWRVVFTPEFAGDWRVSIRCASPNVALDSRDFIVQALTPDAEAVLPPPVSPDLIPTIRG